MKTLNQQIALDFLQHFCQGNIQELSKLLDEDFSFRGPFIELNSKEDYIASLTEDPPKDFGIEILTSFEEENEVGLFYTFSKPNVSTPMAQYFKFNDGKISESLLIFDARALN